MQASIAPAASSTDTARDLYALLVHLMKASQPDVFRALGGLELSLTQIKALHLLEIAGGEMPLGRLAESLGVSLPAASRSVDGLHGRGLVERREDPDDRRLKRVRVREEGFAIVRALHEARLAGIEQFVAELEPDVRDRLAAALAPLAAHPAIARCRPMDQEASSP